MRNKDVIGAPAAARGSMPGIDPRMAAPSSAIQKAGGSDSRPARRKPSPLVIAAANP